MNKNNNIPGCNECVARGVKDGIAHHYKTYIAKRIMYYSYDKNSPENPIPVTVKQVKEIISMNKKGIKADHLYDSRNISNSKRDLQETFTL